MVIKKCVVCGKKFSVHNYRKDSAKVCSLVCGGVRVGEIRRAKAKPRISAKYWFIKKNDYHRANKQGYAKVADLVLEEKLGRKLRKNELAHHIDGNKLNDSSDNLEVMTFHAHCVHTSNNFWKNKKLYKWSAKHKKCITCGTTKIRHWAKGNCRNCYRKHNKLNHKYANYRCST